MRKARLIFVAALLGLSALAGAHHGTTGIGAPAPEAHAAGPEAGPRAFVSSFSGGSFVLPGVVR